MATTYLNVVNNVQRRLRENTTASVSTNSYSNLLGILVNDAKRKIEETYTWAEYRTTVSVAVVANDETATLTGTNFRTKILWGYNDTNPCDLTTIPIGDNLLNNVISTGAVSGNVTSYSLGGWDNDGQIIVNLYPKANGSETLIFGVYQPASDLSADSDVVRIPSHVLELGTMVLAISERGEDGGQLFDETVLQYNRALTQMLSTESNAHPYDFEWSNQEVWHSR